MLRVDFVGGRQYEQVLGMRLRAIFPMHGVAGAKHCFLEAGNGAEISFVQFAPGTEAAAANDAGGDVASKGASYYPTAVGQQHHFAFRCATKAQFLAMREQISQHCKISAPIDHGMCHSAYFRDPVNGFQLEITFSDPQRAYLPSEYDETLLRRFPEPEEDMFHPKHGEFLERKARL